MQVSRHVGLIIVLNVNKGPFYKNIRYVFDFPLQYHMMALKHPNAVLSLTFLTPSCTWTNVLLCCHVSLDNSITQNRKFRLIDDFWSQLLQSI